VDARANITGRGVFGRHYALPISAVRGGAVHVCPTCYPRTSSNGRLDISLWLNRAVTPNFHNPDRLMPFAFNVADRLRGCHRVPHWATFRLPITMARVCVPGRLGPTMIENGHPASRMEDFSRMN